MSGAAAAAAPLRILLVDDDTVDRMAVRRAVLAAQMNAEVTEAKNAEEALRLLRAQTFDCVLLDFQMPGEDGGYVLRTARAAGIEAPFIMLTGQGDEQVAVELMKAGASDYLSKNSLRPDALDQSVRQTVRLHRSEQQAARAARQLQESESRVRLALDASALGSWDIDLRTRERNWDVRCAEILERSEPPLPSVEDSFEYVHPADRPQVQAAIEAAHRPEGDHLYRSEFRIHREGAPRWVRAMGRVLFEGERAVRFVGTVQDVSAIREAEEEGRRRAEFEHQLMGIVSHDLRNPVQAIMMNAVVLQRREDMPAAAAKSLARIVASAERGGRLLRDLLDFTQARLGGGLPISREQMDAHELGSQTLEEVQASYPDRDLRWEHEGEGRGTWDSDRLAQVLTNLLVNAVTYSAPDSPITLRTLGAQQLTIEVHNRGKAIPAEVLPGLFQPYKRGADASRGQERSIGLGLYIVREIVQSHGGSISVESSDDAGTTFRVVLDREVP